jgi:hypothetical protein
MSTDKTTIMLVLSPNENVLLKILEQGSAQAWNVWVSSLFDRHEVCCVWGHSRPPSPVCVTFDFTNADLSKRDLNDLDLRFAWCFGVNFEGASLQRAELGFVPYANFRQANLSGCSFTGSDLTGADFRGAKLEGVKFEYSFFWRERPPIGLPQCLLEQSASEEIVSTGGQDDSKMNFAVPATILKIPTA